MGKTNSKHGRWKLGKQKASNCKNFAKKFEQIKEKKEGLTAQYITSSLSCEPNFIGCFAENELTSVFITSFPAYLIVNVDSSEMEGSHWITIGIFKETIEIFDPLGFNLFNWNRVPCDFFRFLHRMSVSRHVLISPRIQSDDSSLCGFYAIFYIIQRQFMSFSNINNCFNLVNPSVNDSRLQHFFQ